MFQHRRNDVVSLLYGPADGDVERLRRIVRKDHMFRFRTAEKGRQFHAGPVDQVVRFQRSLMGAP